MARENRKGKAENAVNLEDLYRLLRNEHVQAQGIVDTVPDPLLVLNQDLCVVSASRAFFETFRASRDETLGRPLYELGNRQWDIPELRHLLEEVIPKSTAVIDYEVRHDFPGVGRRTMLLSAHRLFHPDNNSTTLLLSIEDATERRRRDEEKDVLLGELRHRTRNLLTLVQALANQTEAEGRSGEEYRDAFLGRFAALVRAHDLTAVAGNGGDLAGLVRLTLEPYATDPAAVVIEPGPAVALAPTQVLPLGLILHELATNAIKHGALSAPSGRVRVGWGLEEADGRRLLRLGWEERGGPRVAPPGSRGFGTRLIEFAAVRDLGGRAEQTFASKGLSAEITVPLG
jgi:two-component sensor histidine kinase